VSIRIFIYMYILIHGGNYFYYSVKTSISLVAPDLYYSKGNILHIFLNRYLKGY